MGFLDFFRVGKIKEENEALKRKLQLLHADEYFQISERLDKMNQEISDNNSILSKQREEISSLSAQQQKLDKQVTTQANKLSRYKELYRSVEYALDTFLSSNIPGSYLTAFKRLCQMPAILLLLCHIKTFQCSAFPICPDLIQLNRDASLSPCRIHENSHKNYKYQDHSKEKNACCLFIFSFHPFSSFLFDGLRSQNPAAPRNSMESTKTLLPQIRNPDSFACSARFCASRYGILFPLTRSLCELIP